METKPTLIVMAAGIGARFGGVKQLAEADSDGHAIIEYSLFDAVRAGFEKIVFVVSEAILGDFRARVGDRVKSAADVSYAIQRLDDLPAGYAVPEGRAKPWGTAHAVLSADALTPGAFAVINADDFYGASAFRSIYRFLESEASDDLSALVGYRIENTLTENGHVARGICKTTDDGYLVEVVERTRVEPRPGGAAYLDPDSADADESGFVFVPQNTIVSMNIWGFGRRIMDEIRGRFPAFLDAALRDDPLKGEYFLPLIPNQLLAEGSIRVKTLTSPDKWYGVTYADDLPAVRAAIEAMRVAGLYPKRLLERSQGDMKNVKENAGQGK